MRTIRHAALVALLAMAMTVGPASGQIGGAGRDFTESTQDGRVVDNGRALRESIASGRVVRVVVQLADAPLASYTGGRGPGRTKPARGQKLNLGSANARAYASYLEGRRGALRSWLRSNAPNARIEREYSTVLNGAALSIGGVELARLLRAPGVKSVTVARRFRPTMNMGFGLIGTPSIAAELGGRPGQGMRIGIIDTGIQKDHAFFDPTGYRAPAGFPVADNAANLVCCTSAKVIVARSYPDPAIGGPDSAVDTNSHGSHVAGTAAGDANKTATVQGVSIAGLNGIAHRAFLGNYNVFPNGQFEAFDPEIIAALEDAVADGMDVVNMSLGGGVCCTEDMDPLASATNATADAGVIPAVAAGNSGPGFFTVQSPGIASKAITAAASTNPHFVGQPVGGVHSLGTVGGAVGDFDPFDTVWWSWVSLGTNLGCTAPLPAPTADPQIAVISRGACTFTTKVRNAQEAGYDGVIVRNNTAGDPVAMGHDGTDPFPTIPAVMIQFSALAGTSGTATISATFSQFITSPNLTPGGATPNADILARFSSTGPVPLDFRLKPDVSGPGVNVLSAINMVGEWAFFQGTSMATPHVAGAAALVKQKFPSWSPADVKSALVTRAKRPVFDFSVATKDVSPLSRGGGRINLDTARNANATFDPSVVSFGAVPSGSSAEVSITLTNVGMSANSWTLTPMPDVTSCAGMSFSTSVGATPSISPGGSYTFTFMGNVSAGMRGTCHGDLVVDDGTQTHRLPFLLGALGP